MRPAPYSTIPLSANLIPAIHPPTLSLSSPSSPIFPFLHNWIMGGGGWPVLHCFGFHWFKSSSQSRREGTGEASRHLQAVKGAVEVLNGLRASRGPRWCGGMKSNKPGFTHPQAEAGCSFRRLNISLWFSAFPPPFLLCVFVCECMCVFCAWLLQYGKGHVLMVHSWNN